MQELEAEVDGMRSLKRHKPSASDRSEDLKTEVEK